MYLLWTLWCLEKIQNTQLCQVCKGSWSSEDDPYGLLWRHRVRLSEQDKSVLCVSLQDFSWLVALRCCAKTVNT